MIRPVLFLLLAGALVAYAFQVYLRAELPVRGRTLLAAARAAALVLLLVLLFDPAVPRSRAAGSGERWALVDVSRSMAAGDGQAWRRARARADSLQSAGWKVVPFGAAGPADTLPDAPRGTDTRLAPALERAAELGVAGVTVFSDLRIEDPVEAQATLAATPVHVTFQDVGSDVVNAGIAAFRVSDTPRKGDRAGAEVELFAVDTGDSVVVEVREEGRPVATRAVASPAPGRRARATFELPPAREEGWVRYTATVRAPGDAFPSDDQAVAYASVGSREGGLVVVSLRPDWEPRALMEVLEEVTGLQATGYLRVGADRFTPMGRAVQRGAPVDSAAVRRAVGGAALLVVHGLDGRTDQWGRSLPTRVPRALLWPLDAAAAGGLGLRTGASSDGEWYASPDVPASPLAADLAGAHLRDLPPLVDLLPLADPDPGSVPLRLQFRGSGPFAAALVLRRDGVRRQAVVLASGFWRWAARDVEGRDAYRRLWSGVAGWLMEKDPGGAAREARPERRVFAPGQEVRWRIPGEGGDSVRLRVMAAGDTVLDTLVTAGPAVAVGALPPGSYAYQVHGPGNARSEGRFDVEDRTLEMLPVRAAPSAGGAAPGAGDGATGASVGAVRGSRPLRTTPWPYLLILGLLCAEWVGRRRAGLR